MALRHSSWRLVVGLLGAGVASIFLRDNLALPAAFYPATYPEPDRSLVGFLVLLPVGVLIVCLFRQVIGLSSFGLFGPALLGLTFSQSDGLPGIAICGFLLAVGWFLRDRMQDWQLLRVPRSGVLLTLLVFALLGLIVVGRLRGISLGTTISVLPLIILTGMIERFWQLDEEQTLQASLKTLGNTFGMAAVVGLVTSYSGLQAWLLGYPEFLLGVLAGLIVLGRYTGFRLLELYRFRELRREPEPITVTHHQRLGIEPRWERFDGDGQEVLVKRDI